MEKNVDAAAQKVGFDGHKELAVFDVVPKIDLAVTPEAVTPEYLASVNFTVEG